MIEIQNRGKNLFSNSQFNEITTLYQKATYLGDNTYLLKGNLDTRDILANYLTLKKGQTIYLDFDFVEGSKNVYAYIERGIINSDNSFSRIEQIYNPFGSGAVTWDFTNQGKLSWTVTKTGTYIVGILTDYGVTPPVIIKNFQITLSELEYSPALNEKLQLNI